MFFVSVGPDLHTDSLAMAAAHWPSLPGAAHGPAALFHPCTPAVETLQSAAAASSRAPVDCVSDAQVRCRCLGDKEFTNRKEVKSKCALVYVMSVPDLSHMCARILHRRKFECV